MQRYNIRTYGIIINERNEVLLADEVRYGRSFVKFPGGGLKWGEGLAEGLKRELKEELNVEVEVGALFYVNDFFQQSAFNEDDQLISFYFNVLVDTDSVELKGRQRSDKAESFRWLPISKMNEEIFTFPIDKVVAELMRV